MSQEESWDLFRNEHFVDEVLALLVNDRDFLKTASHLLTDNDFQKKQPQEGMERFTVAAVALEFWNRYREPVGKMLDVELQEALRQKNLKPENKQRILDYGATLTNGHKRVAPDLILDKVRQYKIQHHLAVGLQRMTSLIETGRMTTNEFLRIAREAVEGLDRDNGRPINLFSEKDLERRIARRMMQQRRDRFPVLLIDPIDRMIRIIARKHLGLILAPYKRGKTALFIWIALAYVLQGLNVLHFTLEDPKEDLEDRYDAAISNMPITSLNELADRMKERFLWYKRLVRSKLKIVDCTDGNTTIGAVENIWEQERSRGFVADAILIDYDDEIRPMRKQPERRFEFADVYRDYRAVLARHGLFGWIASQTKRGSEDMKIIGGKQTAEDISKIRKATLALSLGLGEWGDDSLFLWVAAHRMDRMNCGANIVTNMERGLFYDREKTLAREKQETGTVD